MKMRSMMLGLAAASALFSTMALAADNLPTKAAPATYAYPTTKCGLYFGVNTVGATAAVENAAVGTQSVQGAIGGIVGYACPAGGSGGYWFADALGDFANLNGSGNGLSLSGPAKFEERFGFGAPVDMIVSLVPGLSSLQNAVPSLIPLPTGVAVVTSNPYLFASFHQDDIGVFDGLGSNKQYLLSAGIGLGNKTRLTNGVVFDPFVEYILPSSQMCVGAAGNGCYKKGPGVQVGAAIEF